MTTGAKPKSKSAQSKGKFQRQFFAPYSLQVAQMRLESRSQQPTMWAWKGETRVQVDTWRVDDTTVGFQVYRAGKSIWTPNFGMPQTRARGALFQQADGSTQVLVYAGTTWFGYLIFGGLMAALWILISYYLIAAYMQTGSLVLPLLSPVILGAAVWYTAFYFEAEHRKLLMIVDETLNKSLMDL